MRRSTIHIITLIACSMLFAACHNKQHSYTPPQSLNDGWSISTPAKEDMDSALINKTITMMHNIAGIDAMVIVKNGKLVADEYNNGYTPQKLHKVWSVSKAVSSALVGIAIDNGMIHTVNDSICKYMPAYFIGVSDSLRAITIKDLLTMTSGIAWVELGGPHSAGYRMAYATDWVRFVLQQPIAHTPGTAYEYSTGNAMLLAPIIKNATGMQADTFAKEYLFQPLGITNYDWVKASEFWTKTEGGELPSAKKPDPPIKYEQPFADYPNTGSGLRMTPRDMAKIGQLYLNKGTWNGTQLISAAWIDSTIQPGAVNPEYGYCWRIGIDTVNGQPLHYYYATGFGGQRIDVYPSLQLVLVFTQHNYSTMTEAEKVTTIIRHHILDAVKK